MYFKSKAKRNTLNIVRKRGKSYLRFLSLGQERREEQMSNVKSSLVSLHECVKKNEILRKICVNAAFKFFEMK
jgi:hypothetical protein